MAISQYLPDHKGLGESVENSSEVDCLVRNQHPTGGNLSPVVGNTTGGHPTFRKTVVIGAASDSDVGGHHDLYAADQRQARQTNSMGRPWNR